MLKNNLGKKVVLITGSTGAIGSETARSFARAGYAVAIHYSNDLEQAQALVQEIVTSGSEACSFQANLSQSSECLRLVKAVADHFKKIDVLVNNAGIYRHVPVGAITPISFYEEVNVNLLAPLLLMQEVINYFPESGGSIVNVSSHCAYDPLPDSSIYGATKAALSNLTLSFSKAVGRKGIRVNAVAPGVVSNKMHQQYTPEAVQHSISSHTALADRFGQPTDISEIIVFLASDAAGWITGQTILANGGKL